MSFELLWFVEDAGFSFGMFSSIIYFLFKSILYDVDCSVCNNKEPFAGNTFHWLLGTPLVARRLKLHCLILCTFSRESTRAYPKVSGLATLNENCKWYSFLSLGAVVSLFCDSV